MDRRLETLASSNRADEFRQGLINLKTELEAELKAVKAGMGDSY